MEDLKARIAHLVQEASEGAVSSEQALDETSNLTDKGFSSLSFLRLIDSIENELGVYVDLESDTTFMQTVDGISGYVSAELAQV
jgi:acyl carrier protein